MKIQLDTRTVPTLTLTSGRTEEFCWDRELSCFALRLRRRRDGALQRTWIVQYRANGRTRRLTLGTGERLTPPQARAAARKALARVDLGEDPQGDKADARRRSALSFAGVVDAYLEVRQGELRPASHYIAKLYLCGPYFKPLHALPIADIARADLAARFAAITRAHSSHTAAAARRAVSALFAWAVQEGWLEANPVIGTRKPADAKPRERVLSDRELAAIWRACGNDDYGRIIKLLILLGARRTEIGGIRSSEIDLDAKTWTLPGERSKNHRPNTLPLPPAALAIIKAASDRGREHLFGRAGFANWVAAKSEIDRRLGDRAQPWRVHDLRRTTATKLGDIGVQPHVVEVILGHRGGFRAGVAGTYNKSPYAREVAAALARWAEHVAALVEGRVGKIVALPRA